MCSKDLSTAGIPPPEEEAVARLLICDLDVHQGDGTAEILKETTGPRGSRKSVENPWVDS